MAEGQQRPEERGPSLRADAAEMAKKHSSEAF
jgi:hypothetical protein